MRSRLILQIHDELLLEVTGAEPARAVMKGIMEGARKLAVPLVVDARWAEVH